MNTKSKEEPLPACGQIKLFDDLVNNWQTTITDGPPCITIDLLYKALSAFTKDNKEPDSMSKYVSHIYKLNKIEELSGILIAAQFYSIIKIIKKGQKYHFDSINTELDRDVSKCMCTHEKISTTDGIHGMQI